MHKFFDRRYRTDVQIIGPGEFYVSKVSDIIMTTLGSCVAVCIYDPKIKTGGMNHFMLPESSKIMESSSLSSGMYGIHAMEEMINNLLSYGARKERLKAKIFGGANMFSKIISDRSGTSVGQQNISFAKRYLIAEGIPILSEDTALDHARKIYFDSSTNKVKLHRLIDRNDQNEVKEAENKFQESIDKKEIEKKITFF